MELTAESLKTIEQLKKKAQGEGRMPSLVKIHALVSELGYWTSFHRSVNTVEYRSAGNVYVNSRHEGKEGRSLEIYTANKYDGGKYIMELDSSDSYYSWNTGGYSRDLLKLVNK